MATALLTAGRILQIPGSETRLLLRLCDILGVSECRDLALIWEPGWLQTKLDFFIFGFWLVLRFSFWMFMGFA